MCGGGEWLRGEDGDNIRLLMVISFTQVLARQPEGTSTGRTRPHWAWCLQQLLSLGSHVGPGWLDQQRRRYPKHTGARGHVIFGWPANTEADHEPRRQGPMNYSKWGQYKVASGDVVHTGPGTAA